MPLVISMSIHCKVDIILGIHLQAGQTAETVEAASWIALTNVCELQTRQLTEEFQVFQGALSKYVIAVGNLQAGEARA